MTTLVDEPPTRPAGPPEHPTGGPPGRSRPRPRRRRRFRKLRIALLVIVVLLAPVAWSYTGYLTAAGNEPIAVRTSDWLRDHGFESVVNDIEQWWYTRTKPTGARPPAQDLPAALRGRHAVPAGADQMVTVARHLLPGEGMWVPVPGLATPAGSVQQTFVRPDRALPSVVANLVRFDQHHTRTVLVPGLKEPGGRHWAWGSEIPPAQRPRTVAAFNAGFKFSGTPGGLYTEGHHAVRPLQAGLASLVVHADGHADVAQWGRDVRLTKDVVGVRQNLALIVDHGAPAPGLSSDRGGRWGTRRSQFQFTWRSALGVDAQGRLLYAAGNKMTLTDLAATMVDAGAVRAMQLDIHDGVVTFDWFRPAPGSSSGVAASKLAPSMQRSATRFLSPDQRDFVTVQTR